MSSPLPGALRARILAQAAAEPAPPRGTQRRKLAAAGVTAAAWLVLLALRHGRRPDWLAEPGWTMWIPLATALAAAVVLVDLAVSRGPTMLGRPVAWLLTSVVAAPAVIGASAVVCERFFASAATLSSLPRGSMVPSLTSLRIAIPCDVMALALGVPLVLLFLGTLAGRALPAPRLLGATAGVCAGSWAHAVLSWVCPFGDAFHIVVGHVVPSVPLALFGAWCVQMYSRRSARRRRS